MATAFTSGASLPTANQWTPSTTHGDPDPELSTPHVFHNENIDDDDLSAYSADFPEPSTAPTHPPNGTTTNGHLHSPTSPFPPRHSSLPPDPTRAPLPIALHATFLSLLLGTSALLTLHLLHHSNPFWRLPFFATTLSTFHLLEFYTTALYNPAAATTAAFLLDNGRAYNVAHSAAFAECLLHFTFFPPPPPPPLPQLSSSPLTTTNTTITMATTLILKTYPSPTTLTLGLLLLLLGQLTRTLAMAHAGPNFNHVIQAHKRPTHTLVTGGIYAWLRHPAYFGFFWWSLGTQLVLGNVVCLAGFAVVLGGFFRRRVRREEELLVAFFGEEYVRYRRRAGVGIPFVG